MSLSDAVSLSLTLIFILSLLHRVHFVHVEFESPAAKYCGIDGLIVNRKLRLQSGRQVF